MVRVRCVGLAVVLAAGPLACQDAPVLRPEIEAPDPGSPAFPYDEIDTLILSIGPEGGEPEVSRMFSRGEAPVLDGVPFGADQVISLSGRSGTAEVAFGRTCALTITADDIPASPHLYFSRTLQWAAGAEPLVRDRAGGGAFTTTDGHGIFVGGDATGVVERFDPVTGAFTPLAAAVAPRSSAQVVPFVGGRALYLGGIDASTGDAVDFFELISPGAVAVRQVVNIDGGPRLVDHAAVQLVDGRVVVIGGRTQALPGAPFSVVGDAWIFEFDDAGGTVTPPAQPVDVLRFPRFSHALTRLGDGPGAAVLVTGGLDAAGVLVAEAELFEPLRGSFAPTTEFSASMLHPRWGHAAVRLADDSVLIIGGVDETGAPVTEVERYVQGDFRSTSFQLAPADGFREHLVIPLRDGSTLIAGGRDAGGGAVASAFIARLDPLNGAAQLVPTASMAAPRAGHAGTLLCDGTVLLVGGTDDPSAPASERYNPLAAGR
jgi:hypothetical protein